ncbi:MAG: hypothetical protein PHS79_03025 [Patescibacteria group bacterium]|nr:hypothetical protein [Patescibacteria group bacterium]
MKKMSVVLWAALAFACALVINLNPAWAQNPPPAASGQCAVFYGASAATQEACRVGDVPLACRAACNVNVTVNCGGAPCALAQPTVAPPPAKKPEWSPPQYQCVDGRDVDDPQDCCHDKVNTTPVLKRQPKYVTVRGIMHQIVVSECSANEHFVEVTLDSLEKAHTRLDEFELEFRAYLEQQSNLDAWQTGQIAIIWSELNKAKQMAANADAKLENVTVIIRSLDKLYSDLRQDVADLRDSKPQFVLGAELWVLGMGDAGVAVAPGLKVGFHSFFPASKAGYYAEGFVGLMYRDGIDPSTGGQGSAYHGGAEGGFMLALSDDKALTGALGFKIDQVFRASDPNFLGTMFGGTLGLHYSIPGTYLGIGVKGMVTGTHKVIYFSDDGLAHTNQQSALFGGGITIDWAADIL